MNISNLFKGGRIGRLNYFLGGLSLYGAIIAAFLVMSIARAIGEIVSFPFVLMYIAVAIGALVIGVSLSIRRLHDMDQSGWLVLLSFIPLVNIAVILILLFKEGTPGANQYGMPASKDAPFVDVVLNNVPAVVPATMQQAPAPAEPVAGSDQTRQG